MITARSAAALLRFACASALSAATGFILTVTIMGEAAPAQAQALGRVAESSIVVGGKQDRLQLKPDQTRTQDGWVIRVVLPSLYDV